MASVRAPTPSQAVDRGRPLASASSWNSLRFTRKSSKDSLKDDTNDVMGNRGQSQSIRRFQSLGFLRRKGSSISIAASPSTSSLTSATTKSGSSHGHSNSGNSNSSTTSQQQYPQVHAAQVKHTHAVSASTVFPSMHPGTTFTLTLTSGPAPPPSAMKPVTTVSFARPPKANPVARRSISLYEATAPKKDLPDVASAASRSGRKRVVPIPPTKTTVVARTPCHYDVTNLRPVRPRSSSLPLDSAVASRAEHVVPTAATGMKSLADAALNTSTSTLELSPSGMASNSTPPRAQHRFAAVYRPPPPLGKTGHPKPALSLSMPSGLSIIEPLTPSAPAMSKPTSTRNNSPSSPYSAASSSRPPPKAPIPVSPGASPELKPLPSLPPVSGSFGTSSPISSRQRSASITKSPAIFSNRTADGGISNVNYNTNIDTSSKGSSRPPHTSPSNGNGPSSYANIVNTNLSNASDRIVGGSAKIVYSAGPSIPINSRRRPSLPLTPVLQEHRDHSVDQADELWGYFKKNGLAPGLTQNRSANGSPTATSAELTRATPRLNVRHDNNVDRFTQTMYLPSQVHTPQTPNSLRTPPLTGGVSPISPFSARPLLTPRPGTDSGIPTERMMARTTQQSQAQIQQPPRPERFRPKHLISQSSSAALPARLPTQDSFLPSAALSPFFDSPFPSPGITLPVTPVTPGTRSWLDSDTESMVLPPSPTAGRIEDELLVNTQTTRRHRP